MKKKQIKKATTKKKFKKALLKKVKTKKISKKVLLIVEDNASLLKALSDKFKREGYEVLQAVNGKEGLKLALKNKPNLIILDILMPVMDGMEMLKELRKGEWGKDVFVIMLTNREPKQDLEEEASRVPYRSAYLMKSDFDIKDIVKLVKNKI